MTSVPFLLIALTPLVVTFTLPEDDGKSRGVRIRVAPRETKDTRRVDHNEPEFLGVMENITVPAGRPVRISCSVKNLGSYKVAWMHFEQSAILAVHSHVITRNPRITVSHENHRTWNLHIANVKEEDGGTYMCQINTATAKTQLGYLNVVVPPDIEDSLSSSDVITREGSNVTLTCSATGSPHPTIKWKRDDHQNVNINRTYSVSEWEGNTLELSRVSRLDMGAYLCIATNGVPPSVSKRIRLSVDFPPMLTIPHQLVSAPIGYNVTLECYTEAHPNSLNYWTREDGQMIYESKKYHIQSLPLDLPYKTEMRLTIVRLRQHDLGTYKCVAKNPRGETDGSIRLYESALMTSTASTILEEGKGPDTHIEFGDPDSRTNGTKGTRKGSKIHPLPTSPNSIVVAIKEGNEKLGLRNSGSTRKHLRSIRYLLLCILTVHFSRTSTLV